MRSEQPGVAQRILETPPTCHWRPQGTLLVSGHKSPGGSVALSAGADLIPEDIRLPWVSPEPLGENRIKLN